MHLPAAMPTAEPSAAAYALRGRVALVTGVSRRVGIGFAIARHLASAGADVFVHGWQQHDQEQPWGADPIGAAGVMAALGADLPPGAGHFAHLETDLADPAAPAALVRAAHDTFGRVDILVANHARSAVQDLFSLTADELDVSFAVNVRATLLLVRTFAEQHDGRSGGRVILFTSGQHVHPMPGELPYIASKGALHQLTPSLAATLVRRGILLNCINPGPTDTGYATPATRAELAARHPQGRWGAPDDVVRLIDWLVSDAGRWVVGQVLVSDGGHYLR
jgi:3-oxoacyl-[acyl-carrier protein] reductase